MVTVVPETVQMAVVVDVRITLLLGAETVTRKGASPYTLPAIAGNVMV